MLATANGGSRSYADDAAVRTACYQAVGDYTGNVGTGALKAFSKQLSGYNPITGTYATDGHTVALTLDSSLCVTAYEALAGRKGAVLVSNYKTGEILCMVSGPSIDPSSDGDVPDGAYINRCINGSFTPGSIFKLITSAAAIENIKDIDSRRFSCAGSLDVNGVSVKCTACTAARRLRTHWPTPATAHSRRSRSSSEPTPSRATPRSSASSIPSR